MFFKKLIYFILTIVFLVHMAIIGYYTKHPVNPSMKVYKKDLKDMEFPMTLKFCVDERIDFHERYKSVGYDHIYGFFDGKSKFNENIIGWNGHNQYNSTLGSTIGKFFS